MVLGKEVIEALVKLKKIIVSPLLTPTLLQELIKYNAIANWRIWIHPKRGHSHKQHSYKGQ